MCPSQNASRRSSLEGRRLGDFVVRDKLGEGGYGEVYRAEQPMLDREAVIKVLHERHDEDKHLIGRFMREAKLASHLEHPFAAHVYAFGAEQDGLLWIAMELVRGTPMDRMLALRGPLPLEQLVPLLAQICEVVHTAHEQGIVHRDLKPANVLVIARAGRLLPKLLDFGIAKLVDAQPSAPAKPAGKRRAAVDATAETLPDVAPVDEIAAAWTGVPSDAPAGASDTTPSFPSTSTAADSAPPRPAPLDRGATQLTQHGQGFGSPPYMAPEQWVNAPTVGACTDIYALGVMTYELLSGRLPFPGETLQDIAIGHATAPVPALGEGFPAALDGVLARAMAKNADERYESALAFAQAVREASGLVVDLPALPRLDEFTRDEVIARAPQPVAEAVAVLESARNAHQAREAMCEVATTAARLIGILALAARSRVGPGTRVDVESVTSALRALRRRDLDAEEWLALARDLCRPFARQRDAFPIPELVELFFDEDAEPISDESSLAGCTAAIDADHGASHDDEQVRAELEARLPLLARVLDKISFLSDYRLAVPRGDYAELWMGAVRSRRASVPVSESVLARGRPALLSAEGKPVLALWPLVQVAAPTPGADEEIFLLAGKGRHGARLISHPHGFERQDEEVWTWFGTSLLDTAPTSPRIDSRGRTPYPGLLAFTAADAEVFFGREEQTQAFLNRLRVQPLLAVVGPSGSGKSSFVQAGVLPELPAGWRAVIMRPGAAPRTTFLAALRAESMASPEVEAALGDDPCALGDALRAEVPRGERVILVIDQLEELFTLCADREERESFSEALVSAARAADDPVRVVLTLRDDFLARAAKLPAFQGHLGSTLQLLTTPEPDDLRRILTEPARRAGYDFEDGDLVDEMVGEVADQPGALALLAFTAAKLWELRDRHFNQLSRKAYEALGGVGGALAQHADTTLAEMRAEHRRLVREAFRHLVTSEGTRAVLTRDELGQLLGGGEESDQVIEELVDARLLVTAEAEAGEVRVEVVHEALLSAWPQLVEWRRADAEGARLRDQLRAAARQWDERGRPKGLLWRDEALAEYELWRARYGSALTDAEAEFGSESLAEAARGRRVRRLLLSGAFAVLATALVVVIWLARRADDQRVRADEQRGLAEESASEAKQRLRDLYEEQGRELLLEGKAARALVYLSEAYQKGLDTPALRFMLAQAARPVEAEVASLDEHTGRVWWAEFSPDGSRIVTCSEDRTAKIWDASTGRELATLAGHDGFVWRARFSPDGNRVVTASFDNTAKIWYANGTLLATLVGHQFYVVDAAFSPDGTRVVTASYDGTARLWEAASGRPIAVLEGHEGLLNSAAFNRDGTRVVTASMDGTARVWDGRTGRLLATLSGHHAPINVARFSPDGTFIATAGWDNTARLWTVRGKLVATFAGHAERVHDVDFSPDGSQLVTASQDGTARLWEVPSAKLLHSLTGHGGQVTSASFSSDGLSVVTSAGDGGVRVWDAQNGTVLATFSGHSSRVDRAAFDPEGKRVITAGWDARAKIWSVPAGRLRKPLHGHTGRVTDLAVDAKSSRAVTVGTDELGIVWDLETGEKLHTLAGHTDVVYRVSLAPDGSRIATCGHDRTGRLWDAWTGTQLGVCKGHEGDVNDIQFSPDGTRLLTVSDDKTVRLWEAHTCEPVATLEGHEQVVVRGVFYPDGSRIATAGWDKTVRIWSTETGELLHTLTGHEENVEAVLVSPDSRWIASASVDKTARIWDARSGALVHVLRGHTGRVNSLEFDADSRRLVTGGEEGAARVWDVATGKLLGTMSGHASYVWSARYGMGTNFIATASDDDTIGIWDGKRLRRLGFLAGHSQPVDQIVFLPDFRLVSAGWDGAVNIWYLHTEARSPAEVAALVRCRVPFSLDAEGTLSAAPLDPSACAADRKLGTAAP